MHFSLSSNYAERLISILSDHSTEVLNWNLVQNYKDLLFVQVRKITVKLRHIIQLFIDGVTHNN